MYICIFIFSVHINFCKFCIMHLSIFIFIFCCCIVSLCTSQYFSSCLFTGMRRALPPLFFFCIFSWVLSDSARNIYPLGPRSAYNSSLFCSSLFHTQIIFLINFIIFTQFAFLSFDLHASVPFTVTSYRKCSWKSFIGLQESHDDHQSTAGMSGWCRCHRQSQWHPLRVKGYALVPLMHLSIASPTPGRPRGIWPLRFARGWGILPQGGFQGWGTLTDASLHCDLRVYRVGLFDHFVCPRVGI